MTGAIAPEGVVIARATTPVDSWAADLIDDMARWNAGEAETLGSPAGEVIAACCGSRHRASLSPTVGPPCQDQGATGLHPAHTQSARPSPFHDGSPAIV
jgi:hypothetical protein